MLNESFLIKHLLPSKTKQSITYSGNFVRVIFRVQQLPNQLT